MKKIRRILSVFIVVTVLLSFAGCSSAEKVNIADINETDIKVRVDLCGSYAGARYITILTNDNKVVSYRGESSTDAYVVSLDEDDDYLSLVDIQRCLDGLKDCGKDDVDFSLGVNDTYYIEMYIGDKIYRFDYGCAKNPYANILTEILLGYSQVKEVDRITPYPSQFRETK